MTEALIGEAQPATTRAPYEQRLLDALHRGTWNDGTLVVDAADSALLDRVVPHLICELLTLAIPPTPTESVSSQ